MCIFWARPFHDKLEWWMSFLQSVFNVVYSTFPLFLCLSLTLCLLHFVFFSACPICSQPAAASGFSWILMLMKSPLLFFVVFSFVFRGCLFYGPPGTGKTLVARALANECSQGERQVSFFMRKGADCLSKWVGESERQLRLLFDQVNHTPPRGTTY